ncbi:MAG: HIT domain-containing protein [Actinomycetia bacterium]|nr:HIT domain-containing protein [Actinomycetes bacterium]MCP4223898.1 HIT domain-containing protein [Actinomycetes bacterium]
MSSCKTCQLTRRRDDGEAPFWDAILRTPGWDLVHSYNTSLEGWLVLVARRHITALAELTDSEAEELGPLVRKVSAALHQVTGCEKTYLAQFAEHPDHQHVHIHLVPRGVDHPSDALGPNVFSLIGDNAAMHIDEKRMNHFAGELHQALAVL